ncbi:MAG: UDP-3-O-(3-hydroxymyristoyl)glucosamine N-acyltransferase [Saprospiraceae bacterium]
MKFSNPIPIQEIAEIINAQILGDGSRQATGLNEINKVESGDITFVDVKKYFAKSLGSAATFVILNEEIECPEGKTLLLHPQPFEAYNYLAKQFRPLAPQLSAQSDKAIVRPTAIIEPNVVIGHHVTIGENAHIQANTVIGEHVTIGNNVIIQPNCTIGSDAFYYKKEEGKHIKWRSIGRVIIEDDVEIGAGCTIAKGVSGDTIIGQGTKLDCQCHIGHGVVIGKHCLFAAQVGIGGKTIIGDHVTLYGQVGVAQRLKIANHVTVMAKSGVGKDLEEGKSYFGAPAIEAREAYKELAAIRQLPEFLRNTYKNQE